MVVHFVGNADGRENIEREILALGAKDIRVAIEPAEAEAEWVAIMSAPNAMTEYQKACTPGYYNGEGKATRSEDLFFGNRYGDGAMAFYRMLANWRQEGQLQGMMLQ